MSENVTPWWRGLAYKRAWIVAAALGLLLLSWLLYAPIQRWLALPLLRFLWNLYALYRLLPGVVLWGLLLLGLYVIGMLALLPERTRRQEFVASGLPAARRVEAFTRWLERTDRAYYRHRLNQIISEIGAQALANEMGLSLDVTRTRLRNGELEIPEVVLQYLQNGLTPWSETIEEESSPPEWLSWLSRAQGQSVPQAPLPLDAGFEPTVFYLEQQLEVKCESEHS